MIDDSLKISIVIPVFNEEKNIYPLVNELDELLRSYQQYEILFVDDGSCDNSLEILKSLCEINKHVFFISFSRNFGHQNALRAGIEKCSGDIVITMDGDHQHPPYLIPKMIEKWFEGYEIIYTTRDDCMNVSSLKKYTAALFYSLLNRITDIDLKKGSADFRLFDRKVVEALKKFDESLIFYRGVVAWLGFKQYEISYIPEQRLQGVSKYTLKKMISLALDGISSFSLFPLRFAAFTGVLISSFSFLYVFYAIYLKIFTEQAVSGWVSVMAGIYFLGGIQLLFLGMCGEYVGRIFMEVKKRPNYIVSETNFPE